MTARRFGPRYPADYKRKDVPLGPAYVGQDELDAVSSLLQTGAYNQSVSQLLRAALRFYLEMKHPEIPAPWAESHLDK